MALLPANLRAAPTCFKSQVQKACREEIGCGLCSEKPRLLDVKGTGSAIQPGLLHLPLIPAVFGSHGAERRMLGWDARQESR